MGYPRSAYKKTLNSLASYGSASARGWGKGWPNCQVGKMKTVSGGGVRVTVRSEVAEMMMYLLQATDKVYNLKSGSTGAYNCRPIGGTSRPSNHSWGLAIDINWNDNPYSTNFKSEIPPKVVEMFQACGWYWGGFYGTRYDTMHFEYIGKPSDVAKHTALAKKYATGVSTPKPVPTPDPEPKNEYGAVFTGAIGSRETKRWDRGEDVKLIQRFFGLEDDGYFGAKTEQKVLDWQRGQDIKADGVFRKTSWDKLRAVLKNF